MKKIAVTILNQKLSADLLNPKVVKQYQTEIDKVTEKANDTEGKTDGYLWKGDCKDWKADHAGVVFRCG